MAADQPLRLHAKGNEGRKVDQPEQSQEQECHKIVLRRCVVPAPQQQADAISGRAVRGDEGVSQFRNGGEAGQLSVEREPDPLPRAWLRVRKLASAALACVHRA